MKAEKLWKFIAENLFAGTPVCLLAVLQSIGSSPGRAGFKMGLNSKGELYGSIGGGIMEHKLVELAKKKLLQHAAVPFLKKQIHSKKAAQDQSGMICSGQQTVAIYFLNPAQLPDILNIVSAFENKKTGLMRLNHLGLSFREGDSQNQYFRFTMENKTVWEYAERLPNREKVFVIGGGHVSLAFCKIMAFLNFEVHLFDDRSDLNTFQSNDFATEKTIIKYQEINRYIPESDENYVVVMTVGYRTDKIILQQLLGRNFKYTGLLGSKAKVAQMFSELKLEGIPEAALNKIFAPVGIPVKSKTPEEIAISIAAQIIQVKNAST